MSGADDELRQRLHGIVLTALRAKPGAGYVRDLASPVIGWTEAVDEALAEWQQRTATAAPESPAVYIRVGDDLIIEEVCSLTGDEIPPGEHRYYATSAPAAQTVPDGFVMMPKFPSESMIDAAMAVHRNDCEREQTGRGALVCMMYYAMRTAHESETPNAN